jgi:hypothetical protein
LTIVTVCYKTRGKNQACFSNIDRAVLPNTRSIEFFNPTPLAPKSGQRRRGHQQIASVLYWCVGKAGTSGAASRKAPQCGPLSVLVIALRGWLSFVANIVR